ncbi:MAG: c-type cytochrome [Caulobacteraceae bacterium]|nr:c-type cytochrome [Caulobacteraceae bacterium]
MKASVEWLWAALRRRPRAAIAAVLLLAAAGAACAAWDASRTASLVSADPDALAASPSLTAFAVSRGRRGFDRYCADCHGVSGKGDASRGVPDLTDHDWLYGQGRASEIEGVIDYGIRAPNAKTWRLARMPAYARPVPYPPEPTMKPLSPDDIRDVIAFLFFIERRRPQSDASQRGGAIFTGRGGCYDCHGPDGHGDPGIGAPNLTDDIWLYGHGGAADIFETIAYGRAGVCPAWSGRLKPGLIREIALYVHALSDRRAPADKGRS